MSTRVIILLFVFISAPHANLAQEAMHVSGYVYADLDQNGKRSPCDPGIPGVLVSNQQDVVLTDENGHYILPARDEMIIFITKPPEYDFHLNYHNNPRFYYIHRPDGSPELDFPGIEPTGPLPGSVDFGLIPSEIKETFQAVIFGDPQTTNHTELSWYRDAFVGEFCLENADFIIALGDIMNDNLSLYGRYNEIMSTAQTPVINVFGNHDMNYDAGGNRYARETFKSYYGPTYYSFEEGNVHFVVLDNIDYLGYDDEGRRSYVGNIGETQLAWLENNLRFVDRDKLIVLMAHIPLYAPGRDNTASLRTGDRKELFTLLEDFDNVLFLGGHVHSISHTFMGPEFGRSNPNPVHQLLVAAASGSWWGGPYCKNGIPVSTQRDGSPKGYHLFSFHVNSFSEQLKPSGLDAGYQIRIESPGGDVTVECLEDLEIRANVFNSSEHSEVYFRLNGGEWVSMERDELSLSGHFINMLEEYPEEFGSLQPIRTSNIWAAPLHLPLQPGPHRIDIRTRDMYGQEFRQTKVIEVRGL